MPREGREFAASLAAHDLPVRRDVKAQALRLLLMTGSIGLLLVVARRLFRRRPPDVNVGSVSEDWLAQQRGSDPPVW
jgi:hypothetical protein